MRVYGRQNGRGMAHILVEALDADRGVAACGCPILSIAAQAVPEGAVCHTCLATVGQGQSPREVAHERALPARDTQRISIPEASKECGLALSSLQQAARNGRLKTEKPSPKVRLTTRRWLRDYLDSRPERFQRRKAETAAP